MCSSRRSTDLRSTSPTRTASSRAARRAATARSGRTSPSTCARSTRSRCACSATTCRRSLEVRGEVYMPLSGFRELNERLVAEGQEADAEPAQRRRRLAAPEGLAHHRRAPARRSGPTASACTTAPRSRRHWETLAWLKRARLPDQPLRRAARVDRRGREGVPRVGAQARRPRLRDRRDRDQGRRLRAAAAPRRAPLASALGARVQVGADDRDDAAREDHDPRRPHGRAQPVGDPAAGGGRRRDDLARDAAQRGGHQPQGDPRGRRRDRPARGRRDPADRRAGRRAPPRHEGVPDAGALPAVRHADREAGGRGDAPLPEPRLPVARPRDADQLGGGAGGHRRRRRADASARSGTRALCARCPTSTG